MRLRYILLYILTMVAIVCSQGHNATGNIRLTVHKDASSYSNQMAVVTNDYYPYGNIFRGSSGYKYSGKYLDRTYGLDIYDFHARQYETQLPVFTSIDPLAEKYYDTSPYAYCAGDPVNKIDPTGKFIETAWDVANLMMDVASLAYNIS